LCVLALNTFHLADFGYLVKALVCSFSQHFSLS
jgi:hypothetical protein